MNGTNCSIAIGLGTSAGLPAHIFLAVPAEDSCTTIGCIVSFRFSMNIFQLHVVREAQAAAGDLEFALGRTVGHVVDRAQRIAEVLFEVRARVAELDEDEAAVQRTLFHRRQALAGLALASCRVPS